MCWVSKQVESSEKERQKEVLPLILKWVVFAYKDEIILVIDKNYLVGFIFKCPWQFVCDKLVTENNFFLQKEVLQKENIEKYFNICLYKMIICFV